MRKPLEVLILAAALTTLSAGISFSEGSNNYNIPQRISYPVRTSQQTGNQGAFKPQEITLHFKNFDNFGLMELINFEKVGGSYFDFTLGYDYHGTNVSVKYELNKNPGKDGLYPANPYLYRVNNGEWKGMKEFKDEIFIPKDMEVIIDIWGKNITAKYISDNGAIVKSRYERSGKNPKGDFIANLE